jgi:hypothetical protein
MLLSTSATVLVGLTVAAAAAVSSSAASVAPLVQAPFLSSASAEYKVDLTLGVMSRCPDAFLVEALIDRTLADERVNGKVALELVYIGALERNGVTCKHGELECAGNVQQLCAAAHLDQGSWWPFVVCQNGEPSRIGTTDLAEECAARVGFAWAGAVRGCAEGDEGKGRLQANVERSQALGVEKSATVLLGEEHKVRHALPCTLRRSLSAAAEQVSCAPFASRSGASTMASGSRATVPSSPTPNDLLHVDPG